MWHPRDVAIPVAWSLDYAPAAEPIALIRRLDFEADTFHRATTGATNPADRVLIGYYPTGDDAAEACWRRYVQAAHDQHEAAARVHGSADRHPPAD